MNISFRINEDNQFLTQELEQFPIKGSKSFSTDQIVTKLQQKNHILKKQVNKIDRALSVMKMQQKPRYGISLPQIKPDAMKKQLQNAYKQIKIYQHQVQRRRNTFNSQSTYVQQVNKIQRVFKEKAQIHERLKRQMLVVKHEFKELTKQLKNQTKKQHYLLLESKLTTDIKYTQQKVRQYEQKRTAHISQLQRQRASIRDMEVQILKENSNEFLEAMRFKIFKPTNSQINSNMSPSRSIFDIENEAAKEQSRVSKMQPETQEVQDNTPQAYASLQNDIKLLKKMHSDYESKINLTTKQRDQASQENFKSRNRLLQVQFQIQTVQKNILQLKRLIDPNLFKPKLFKSQQDKKQPAKKKHLSILHNFKFTQLGQITRNGKRFSDRALIGKIRSKIIGITLYQKQQTEQLVGFEATYKLADQKESVRKGNVNTRVDMKKQVLHQESLKLEGEDYFKTIDLFRRKQKIVGISMVSHKNKIIKAGDLQGQRLPLATRQSEYPMCFFGSLLADGFQCLGVQIFQQGDSKQSP